MEKEINKNKSSQGGKANNYLFRGIMYLLYGKKAGETIAEKITRLGVIIIILAALIVVLSKLFS
ncbi:hypothetical protein LR003_04125 [candidate division NPL-UPA2 bacterium]|nr:hypothetical protein [candidate division NPL-UPA2 bacterium]